MHECPNESFKLTKSVFHYTGQAVPWNRSSITEAVS